MRKSTNEQLAYNLLGLVNFPVFTVKIAWKEIRSGKIAYNNEFEGEIERFKLFPRGQNIIQEYSGNGGFSLPLKLRSVKQYWHSE